MNTITGKLYKSGNSYSLRLPKRVVDDAQLTPGQSVTITTLQPTAEPEVSEAKRQKVLAAFQALHQVIKDNPDGGIAQITDSVAWQREVRQDRPLPGRD